MFPEPMTGAMSNEFNEIKINTNNTFPRSVDEITLCLFLAAAPAGGVYRLIMVTNFKIKRILKLSPAITKRSNLLAFVDAVPSAL